MEAAGLARFEGARATVFALDRVGFEAVFVVEGGREVVSSAGAASSLGRSKVLSRADVAGEHDATDETAARTASAWARSVSMKKGCNGLILDHIITVSGFGYPKASENTGAVSPKPKVGAGIGAGS